MRKILISINPEHVNNIFSGIKKFEYRKKVAKKDIKSIIIYSTYPEKRIVGEAKIRSIIAETPENLWRKTKDYSGISKEFFDVYFMGREIAYAYELYDVKKYKKPKQLLAYGVHCAPQSFIYIEARV